MFKWKEVISHPESCWLFIYVGCPSRAKPFDWATRALRSTKAKKTSRNVFIYMYRVSVVSPVMLPLYGCSIYLFIFTMWLWIWRPISDLSNLCHLYDMARLLSAKTRQKLALHSKWCHLPIKSNCSIFWSRSSCVDTSSMYEVSPHFSPLEGSSRSWWLLFVHCFAGLKTCISRER